MDADETLTITVFGRARKITIDIQGGDNETPRAKSYPVAAGTRRIVAMLVRLLQPAVLSDQANIKRHMRKLRNKLNDELA